MRPGRGECSKERRGRAEPCRGTQGVLELGAPRRRGETMCARPSRFACGSVVVFGVAHGLFPSRRPWPCLTCRSRVHPAPPNHIHPLTLAPEVALNPATASHPNPTPPRPSCRPPAQYMPISSRLQRTLLYPRAISLAFVQTTCDRAMSTKPSLAAAEDFLSFVNASPTRMLALYTVSACAIIDPSSLPCCQVGQRAVRKGRL
jgi:hypothetical protein